MNRIYDKVIKLAALGVVLLTVSCATTPGSSSSSSSPSSTAPGTIVVPPPDSSDKCDDYRKPFRQAAEEQQRKLAELENSWWKKPLADGGSYLACLAAGKPDQQCVDATKVAAVKSTNTDPLTEMDTDSASLSKEIGNADKMVSQLYECRVKHINELRNNYRKKKIDRDTAKSELAKVEVKLKEDQSLTKTFFDVTDQRVKLQTETMAVVDRPTGGTRSKSSKEAKRISRTVDKNKKLATTLRNKTQKKQENAQRSVDQLKILLG